MSRDTSRDPLPRRDFLRLGAAGAGLALAPGFPSILAGEPAKKLRVGVMGLGRGMAHVESFLALPDVEVAYHCEVDERRLEPALKAVEARGAPRPKTVKDLRKVLDDPSVDIVSIAAPNFWHAPATILACAAGKHVYVEKPGSHNPREAELMVEAARHHQRVVQMGNQRRSQPGIREGMERLRRGDLGRVFYARCFYTSARGPIGRGKETAPPAWLDYEQWEGPIPHRPYRDNLVHYNWHWMWHWGGGELANNGVHALDLARWGLGVDYAHRVTLNGGRYHHEDDQETPDTATAVFDFGGQGISWETSSCLPRRGEDLPIAAFYAEKGTLSIEGSGYRIVGPDGKKVEEKGGEWKETFHFADFLDGIRSGKTPNAEIADAQKSALLCHLGNIAYRTGRTIHCDRKTGRITGDDEAVRRFWGREYRSGWEPRIS